MLDIKKKLIAIATICAMAVSMSACSDEETEKKNGTANNLQVATLSPEEATALMEDQFQIAELTEGDIVLGQDPVEQDNAGNIEQDPVEQDPVEQDPAEPQGGNQIVDADGDEVIDNVDLQINPVDGAENDEGDTQDATNADGNGNTSTEGGNSALVESTGVKKIQQAFWMNLKGDFFFEGEFITATFKIKETTANGTYPITVEWLDFSNIKGVSLDDVSGVDGSVVVGGAAETNEFGSGFQVKADCVSGNPGDEVTVTFQMKENPGICACVFRFGYDSDALEYVSGSKGADFINAIATQNKGN